ncbi:hypothetical protein GQ55_8G244100 [Panicum hallii var. hallii]|uniref:Uncharacterized protein n=1 Tax=Panicum hallii var. hallii TaxID=1504633 RepID=A0A2T7CQP8_9POAL|nr:hypothetical protein GQ55_8G244100 [Panicum hallii var. hallii]
MACVVQQPGAAGRRETQPELAGAKVSEPRREAEAAFVAAAGVDGISNTVHPLGACEPSDVVCAAQIDWITEGGSRRALPRQSLSRTPGQSESEAAARSSTGSGEGEREEGCSLAWPSSRAPPAARPSGCSQFVKTLRHGRLRAPLGKPGRSSFRSAGWLLPASFGRSSPAGT